MPSRVVPQGLDEHGNVKYVLEEDDSPQTAISETSKSDPSVTVVRQVEKEPVLKDHSHPEYEGKGHVHPDLHSQEIMNLSAQVSLGTEKLSSVEGKLDALGVDYHRSSQDLRGKSLVQDESLRKLDHKVDTHTHEFAPAAHTHSVSEDRLRALEAAVEVLSGVVKENISQLVPHTHPEYANSLETDDRIKESKRKVENLIGSLDQAIEQLTKRDDDVVAALKGHTHSLEKHEHPLPAHSHDGAQVEVITAEDQRGQVDHLLQGHELHIIGKIDVHGRGPEKMYACECGFRIMASDLEKLRGR